MAFALYSQYVLHLEPCPLCIFQRVGVISVGIIACWRPCITRAYGLSGMGCIGCAGGDGWWCGVFAAVVAAKLAGRHGSCLRAWPGLPDGNFTDVGCAVQGIQGSGECAKVDWTFLGQAMPFWVAVFFVGVIVLQLWLAFRKS
jgi:disulfide bond formation protein DsbB